MILSRQFPDIKWLKSQIERGYFQNPVHGTTHKGFPSVIISANTKREERTNIKASLSLFMNLEGESECVIDGKLRKIPLKYFCLSNKDQPYSLLMEKPVKTFNIHFGDEFVEQLLPSLTTSYEDLLENYSFSNSNVASKTIEFPNQLYRKNPQFLSILWHLQKAHQENYQNSLFWEEYMRTLFLHLLSKRKDIISDIKRIPALKKTTQTEIYQRLSYAMDFLQTYFHQNIDLEALAATACLSKFHFLRLFKAAFGFSPYQYVQYLRIERAKTLLQKTNLPICQIALELGFQNATSFSRLFFKKINCYPNYYRSQSR
ncbi:helix-turn-helix domain-containing protein [Bernardetia sp.]|uniref:helix-turn-helix domain-containing protein n=1 Tax=Bernardetia sp. TaxID=1937974 RepID=UPI0025BEF065|nr:AraC family transcriptional regulator [Bernardetia sp.]